MKKVLVSAAVLLFGLQVSKSQQGIGRDSLLHLVKQAYIYGYPIEQSYRMYVTRPDNIGQTRKVYNHFSYADKLAVAANDNAGKVAAYKATRNRGGAGPNNDTPYFGSLLDLTDGPVVLTVPDFQHRYYSFQFINFFNKNVFYIGSSFGDSLAAKYLLIGPGWKGKVPAGLKPVYLHDNRLNLFGRVLVEDDTIDIKNVIALQHQACLTLLKVWPAEERLYAGDEHNELPGFYNDIDSFFTNLGNALRLSPAPAQDKAILKKLRPISVAAGSGFAWGSYDAATRQLIHNTLVETDSLLDAEGASGDVSFGNGWRRTNPKVGNWGTDYWNEALYIKHGFYAGHTQTECFYIVPVSREGHGYFKGNHKYKIHFAKNAFPPLGQKGFWSITANEIPGYFLLPNPIHRAAIRDRTKNLQYNHRKDLIGSSVIYGTMLISLWAIFSWLPTWIQSLITGGDAQKARGLSMMLLGMGGLVGGFFSGWIVRAVGIQRSIIIAFSTCAVLSFILFKSNSSFSQVIYLEIGVLSIFFGLNMGILSSYIPQLFPTSIRATATGFSLNVGRLFTGLAVLFVGVLVSIMGGYGNALLIFSMIFLFGLVTVLFVKPK